MQWGQPRSPRSLGQRSTLPTSQLALEAPGLDYQGSPAATLSAGPRGRTLPNPALSPRPDLDGDLCGGCKRPLEVGPGDRGQDSQEAPRMRVGACPAMPPLGTVRP